MINEIHILALKPNGEINHCLGQGCIWIYWIDGIAYQKRVNSEELKDLKENGYAIY